MYNKITLLGRLTKDPELKTTKTEKHVCNVSVATNSYHGGESNTSYFELVGWGKTAERMAQLSKGNAIMCEGEIQTDTWEDNDGKKRSRQKVNVSKIYKVTIESVGKDGEQRQGSTLEPF